MKILFFLLLFSSSVFSETTMLKTFNGGVPRCASLADVESRSYSFHLVSEKINPKIKKREMTFELQFFKCVKTTKGMAYIKSSIDESINSYMIENGILVTAKNKLSHVKFDAVTEDSDLLSGGSLNRSSTGNCLVSFSIDSSIKKMLILASFVNTAISPMGQVSEGVRSSGGDYIVNF